jgi:FRG domain
MNGQWLGRYTGTNSGTLFINLDDMGSHYAGNVFAYDDNTSLPFIYSYIRTPNKQTPCHLCLDLAPLHPHTGDPSNWTQISSLFPPNAVCPRRAEADFELDNAVLKVRWRTDIETFGSADIAATHAGEPSEYEPLAEVNSWAAFKSYVIGLDHRRYIFRGQLNSLRLRTGFHRTGRADLIRFLTQDIPTLHRHLSQRTTHIFNLGIAEHNGAFFNLVQHHGYPTPLLDWTYSPYVGAFFAYQKVKNSEAHKATADDNVRVFIFDQMQWRSTYNQIPKVTSCPPHFSIQEFIAIDNERLIPQQSISSITNIDDIESYIRSKETPERRYLQVIDLPLSERPHVMRELSVMGITAGSLFPGLDGACEELKERNFDL